jgi:hypothetical protein
MKIAYGIAGILAALGTFAAGYLQLIELVVAGGLLSIALLFFANIDKITRIKASPTGIEAETRAVLDKANATIEEMRLIGKIVARTTLSHVMRAGRLASYSDEEKVALFKEILGAVTELGVSKEDQAQIAKDWHAFTKYDYAYFILRAHPKEFYGNEAAIGAWKSMQRREVENIPTPEEIETLLKNQNAVTAQRQELIEDYRYYVRTSEHRDLDRWRDRAEWRVRFIQ